MVNYGANSCKLCKAAFQFEMQLMKMCDKLFRNTTDGKIFKVRPTLVFVLVLILMDLGFLAIRKIKVNDLKRRKRPINEELVLIF